jgi:hypothetical protein
MRKPKAEWLGGFMRNGYRLASAWLLCAVGAMLLPAAGAAPLQAATAEVVKNEKVVVTEETLTPGGRETLVGGHASVVVYLGGDEAEMKYADGRVRRWAVRRGETVNEPAGAGTLIDTGRKALRLVRVEFLAGGSGETWGRTGLPPNYRVLFEDRHSRTYNIRIPAHFTEQQHTHHTRVVVCLSGATLQHELPDGRKQTATLKTNEVVWRPGQTHKGHNLGNTDLWAIAIEPK